MSGISSDARTIFEMSKFALEKNREQRDAILKSWLNDFQLQKPEGGLEGEIRSWLEQLPDLMSDMEDRLVVRLELAGRGLVAAPTLPPQPAPTLTYRGLCRLLGVATRLPCRQELLAWLVGADWTGLELAQQEECLARITVLAGGQLYPALQRYISLVSAAAGQPSSSRWQFGDLVLEAGDTQVELCFVPRCT